jgi:hypothetical protein
MPKSRKRPQRRPHANGRRDRHTKAPADDARPVRSRETLPVTFGDFSISRGLGIGEATDDDWQQLHDALLAEYPVCPDCEAPWDLANANEEEGINFDGSRDISITVFCSAYEDDLDAGPQPRRHVLSDDGMITHSLALA